MEGQREVVEERRFQMICRGVRMEVLMEAVEGAEGKRPPMICPGARKVGWKEAAEEVELWA